jgi:hypothetical protein
MTVHRRRQIGLIGLTIGVFVVWFTWNSFVRDKTLWIENKAEAALANSMTSLAPQLSRIKIVDNNAGETFYAPNTYSLAAAWQVYGEMLKVLNQDVSVPPVKVTLVNVRNEYSDSQTSVVGQATVEFPLWAGIEKQIVIHSTIQVPHYQSAN